MLFNVAVSVEGNTSAGLPSSSDSYRAIVGAGSQLWIVPHRAVGQSAAPKWPGTQMSLPI